MNASSTMTHDHDAGPLAVLLLWRRVGFSAESRWSLLAAGPGGLPGADWHCVRNVSLSGQHGVTLANHVPIARRKNDASRLDKDFVTRWPPGSNAQFRNTNGKLSIPPWGGTVRLSTR